MRKSLWLVLALLVLAGAPLAHADSFTPTFTCTANCTTPTAPDVTFPSPTITATFAGDTFDFPLFPGGWLPGDTYTWGVASLCNPACSSRIEIHDVTQGLLAFSDSSVVSGSLSGRGDLTFTPVTATTPEPSSLALIPLGPGPYCSCGSASVHWLFEPAHFARRKS